MVLIVFRSRMNKGAEPRGRSDRHKAVRIATTMPGFVSFHDYTSADGESVTIVQFESHEALAAWRNHPEHLAGQRAGRERIFSEYKISVCDVVRESVFPKPSARVTPAWPYSGPRLCVRHLPGA